jgi:DNA repair protein RadC
MDQSEGPYRVRLKTFSVVKVAESAVTPSTPISTPAAAAEYLQYYFKTADAGQEHFAGLFLDGKHRALAAKILFSGSSNQAVVYPGQVARIAVLLGASALVIAHNHPSGNDLNPSHEDISLTRRIEEALKLLDIRLLDSLVLDADSGRFHSLRLNGEMSSLPKNNY